MVAGSRRSPGLPSWWQTGIHDKPFLKGLAKHGVGRQDLILEDEDLPFAGISTNLAVIRQEWLLKKELEGSMGPEDTRDDKSLLSIKEEVVSSDGMLLDAVKLEFQEKQEKQEPQGLKPEGATVSPADDPMQIEQKLDEMLVKEPTAFDLGESLFQHESGVDMETVADITAKSEVMKDTLADDIKIKDEAGPSDAIKPKSEPANISKASTRPAEPEEFAWLKEAVVLRRIDHLIDIIQNPKPVSKKKRRSHAAQLAILAKQGAKMKGSESDDASDRDDEEDGTPTPVPSIPPSPDKKRKRPPQNNKKPDKNRMQLTSLVESSYSSSPGGPSDKAKDKKKQPKSAPKQGLKLTIKLKLPTAESATKKIEKVSSSKVRREDNSDESSSGSDTDEMISMASKQVEYLQRKINEKKQQRSGSPASVGGKSSSKPKGLYPGSSTPMRLSPTQPSGQYTNSHRSEARRRGRSRSMSSRSSRSRSRSQSWPRSRSRSRSVSRSRRRSRRSYSRSSSSASSSSSSSASGSSSSGSSSDSDSDSSKRRRRILLKRKRSGRDGAKMKKRRRSRSRSLSRSSSRSRTRPRSRSRLRSFSRSVSRSRSRSRSRARSLSRSSSRSRSRSVSPLDRRYRPSGATMPSSSSSSAAASHSTPSTYKQKVSPTFMSTFSGKAKGKPTQKQEKGSNGAQVKGGAGVKKATKAKNPAGSNKASNGKRKHSGGDTAKYEVEESVGRAFSPLSDEDDDDDDDDDGTFSDNNGYHKKYKV